MRVLSWVIALLGIWEAGDILLPLVVGVGGVRATVWDHILVGIILLAAGVWAARTSSLRTARTMHWITAVAGAWLIIASFVLEKLAAAALWNDILVGVAAAVLSGISILFAPRIAG
jgi:hypothetical protein